MARIGVRNKSAEELRLRGRIRFASGLGVEVWGQGLGLRTADDTRADRADTRV